VSKEATPTQRMLTIGTLCVTFMNVLMIALGTFPIRHEISDIQETLNKIVLM
jgi:hypothetical protein